MPNSSEGLYGTLRGIRGHLTNMSMNLAISSIPFPAGWNPVHYADSDEDSTNDIYVNPIVWSNNVQSNLIEIDSQRFPNAVPFFAIAVPDQRANNLIKIKKNFDSDARVEVSGTFKNNYSVLNGQKFLIQSVRRDRLAPGTEDTVNDFGSWEVLGEQTFISTYNVTINFSADIYIPAKDYNVNQQLQVRILRKQTNNAIQCQINSASIKFAKVENTNSTVELGIGDNIAPVVPEGVKQYDFIKSIAGLFNLYIYNQKENPKHIIFQTYNDYYGFTTANYIKSSAIDWTNKVDYSKGFEGKPNTTIPKKYLFTMKEDSDYLNQTYKTKYGQTMVH